MRRLGLILVGIVLFAACTLPTPTPTPALEKTPTVARSESAIKADYRGDVDVRDVYKNVDSYKDKKLKFSGTVLTIQSTKDGTYLQLTVSYQSDTGGTKVIDFVFPASVSTEGVYEDDHVTAWGRLQKMDTITNGFGAKIDQPLFIGDYLSRDSGN